MEAIEFQAVFVRPSQGQFFVLRNYKWLPVNISLVAPIKAYNKIDEKLL